MTLVNFTIFFFGEYFTVILLLIYRRHLTLTEDIKINVKPVNIQCLIPTTDCRYV